ncbi:Mediator of RNA polymerase II transcription subunit 7 [Lobulomyces angularis]|nr:Mediator of RNA polymerase II transcription subunit 7 [Lobulomyces angularis]
MAEGFSSAMPLPPPFYKLYTDEHIEIFNNWKSTLTEETKFEQPPLSINASTLESQSEPLYLDPPKIITGLYSMFGFENDTDEHIRSLEELKIEKLFVENEDGQVDRSTELKKLNLDVLKNFVELLRTLRKNPYNYEEKVEKIRLTLINMHYLLNGYRPHQARDILILMMEQQIQRRKEMKEELHKCCVEVRKMINTARKKIDDELIKNEEINLMENLNQNSSNLIDENEETKKLDRLKLMPEKLLELTTLLKKANEI